MGMFSNLTVPDKFLPENCRGFSDWQTKDVIEPILDDLVITEDGSLFHVWWDYKGVEDKADFFGFHMERIREHRDKLEYHGDMIFYTSVGHYPDYKFITLCARFTDGKLEKITLLKDTRTR